MSSIHGTAYPAKTRFQELGNGSVSVDDDGLRPVAFHRPKPVIGIVAEQPTRWMPAGW